ncbi:MAG: pilus assembly protein [Gemmataceae bacterium]|nr:pilus assembly protein [Gemmataceae bacterium]
MRFRSDGSKVSRRGAVLVEFAVIALVLYLLLAFTLELGRATYTVQVLTQAADASARELARVSLPPEMTFEQALKHPEVLKGVFNEEFLIIDLDQLGGKTLDEYFAGLPVLNQQLRPLMIFEPTSGKGRLRYPPGLTVPVVQEAAPGHFALDAGNPSSGRVSLRVNYPFQATTLNDSTRQPFRLVLSEQSGSYRREVFGP